MRLPGTPAVTPHSAAVAGDLVFRTLTYLLQIPAGGITAQYPVVSRAG